MLDNSLTRDDDDVSCEIVEPRGEEGEGGVLLQDGPEPDGDEDEARREEEHVEQRERELETGYPAAAVAVSAACVSAAALNYIDHIYKDLETKYQQISQNLVGKSML